MFESDDQWGSNRCNVRGELSFNLQKLVSQWFLDRYNILRLYVSMYIDCTIEKLHALKPHTTH